MSEKNDRTTDAEFEYELRAFIMEAADKCYVTGQVEKTTIAELPGSKVFRYKRDNFLFVDVYSVNGEQSGGTTTVYLNDEPVWIFQYQGWCENDEPETVAFLKEALHDCYSKGVWTAARGGRSFMGKGRWSGFDYCNLVDRGSLDDLTFSGYEAIDLYQATVFYHHYRARLLLRE